MTATAFRPAVTDEELIGHFQPLIDRLEAGAVERETSRTLPVAEIKELFAAGIGRVRVPVEHGGFGASLAQLTRLLIELAAADPNIVQALHGHLGFVENVLTNPDPAVRDFWFPRFVAGESVGDAQSERTGVRSTWTTRFTRHDDGRVTVTGEKYYTTGTIYADWALVGGSTDDGRHAAAVVATNQPGVTVTDDWDGFGQQLTGSGSATFRAAEVIPELLWFPSPEAFKANIQIVIYQHNLLTALAGINKAVLRDGIEFVKGRTRNLYKPEITVAEDPFAQQLIGRLNGLAATSAAAVVAAAESLDRASQALVAGADASGLIVAADTEVYSIQSVVIDLALEAATKLFDLGGASALATGRKLDRHWRNARTLATHNSILHRTALVGESLLSGATPTDLFFRSFAGEPPAEYAQKLAAANGASGAGSAEAAR